MPNKPNPDKHLVGVRMPRPLYERLKKLAKQRGEPLKDTILSILNIQTNNIVLTHEDYERIAKDTAAAEKKYSQR